MTILAALVILPSVKADSPKDKDAKKWEPVEQYWEAQGLVKAKAQQNPLLELILGLAIGDRNYRSEDRVEMHKIKIC